MADGVSGKPLWMASTRADMSGSLAVAVHTSSHVTDLMSSVAVDAQVCEQRDHASVRLPGVLQTNVGHSTFRCVI